MQAPLPAPWVDRLFDRLTMVYGHAFLARWSGMDLAAVKASWAHELGGFATRPKALADALEALPVEPPKNVVEFRNLVRDAARRLDDLALPPPDPTPDPAKVAMVVEAMNSAPKRLAVSPAQQCAERLRHLRDHGDRPLTLAQRAMLASVERVLGEGAAA
jgi:hypothetical protein